MESRKRLCIVCFFIFIVFLIGIVVGYRKMEQQAQKKEISLQKELQKQKKEQKRQEEQAKVNKKGIWDHVVRYKNKNFTLPCSYERLQKILDIRNIEKETGKATLASGEEIFLSFQQPDEEKAQYKKVYGITFRSKNFSIGEISVKKKWKDIYKYLGKSDESENNRGLITQIYYNPQSKTEHEDETLWITMDQSGNIQSIHYFYDGTYLIE